MGIALSVIIPAFDEAERIGPALAAVRRYFESRAVPAEIIVVDDGSRDGTAARAEAALSGFAASRIIRLPGNLGKGEAVKAGVLEARGDLVLFSDADLSTPIEEIEKFLPLIEGGADVVIGSRALPGSDIQVRQRALREGMGKFFNRLVRGFVLKGIPDTQCGFKLFRRDAARAVFSEARIRGFCFDVEILALCVRRGYRIRQVPVVWRHSPPSRVRLVRSSLRMIVDLVRVRRRLGRGRANAAEAPPTSPQGR
jgi:dolichyl-phosphate beta-glucosyltransferase